MTADSINCIVTCFSLSFVGVFHCHLFQEFESTVTKDQINHAVTYGEWRNIFLPAGRTSQVTVFNYDPRHYSLQLTLYHIRLSCSYAQLYVQFSDRRGSKRTAGPFCAELEVAPVISYKGNVKLFVTGFLPSIKQINAYYKLLPGKCFL